jgi:hypothetical protein
VQLFDAALLGSAPCSSFSQVHIEDKKKQQSILAQHIFISR